MIDQLDALAALRSAGTMGRAATVLRLTQSAVSKRIAALEASVGTRLIERHGRRVRLTADAERILEQARPLLASLREVLQARAPASHALLRVAASDSLLASFLPASLRAALDRLPQLTIELHAHRERFLFALVADPPSRADVRSRLRDAGVDRDAHPRSNRAARTHLR